MKDKIFKKPIEKQFEFDEGVASVFDDMLSRSIPFYQEAQDIVKYITCKAISASNKNKMIVYDLGCSTASTLLNIEASVSDDKATLIGIDNSVAMIKQAKNKVNVLSSSVKLYCDDILSFGYKTADIFLSNYTLQFIRPLDREQFISKLSNKLDADGIFLFSEKLISEDKRLNKLLIDYYHQFKEKNGYSKYEIMQKREALENVLVPYSEAENISMLKKCGFRHCEVIFRWGNFATFIAYK